VPQAVPLWAPLLETLPPARSSALVTRVVNNGGIAGKHQTS
jgi:hypothetical protein